MVAVVWVKTQHQILPHSCLILHVCHPSKSSHSKSQPRSRSMLEKHCHLSAFNPPQTTLWISDRFVENALRLFHLLTSEAEAVQCIAFSPNQFQLFCLGHTNRMLDIATHTNTSDVLPLYKFGKVSRNHGSKTPPPPYLMHILYRTCLDGGYACSVLSM